MVYNPITDFLGLWRNNAGQVSKVEMPGLDYVVAALARAGTITLSVSATAPLANQSVTAWLRAAVPSYSGEGTLQLWNAAAGAYAAATPALFFDMLQACAGQNGVSWWTAAGGPPANTVGNNGDYSFRTDAPYGVYGPKAAGAWPKAAIPGTQDIITSTSLDNTFGGTEGEFIYRDAAAWQALPIGPANSVMVSSGLVPQWEALTTLFDTIFSGVRGALLYRAAGSWGALGPGTSGYVLGTTGPGTDPAWVPRTPEFPAGTVMLFQQTAAPVGWTKQTLLNDYGLRVTSGAVGTTGGTPFSSVFAQTNVGSTTLSVASTPSHNHPTSIDGLGVSIYAGGGNPGLTGSASVGIGDTIFNLASAGGGAPHSHSINLSLSYVDVIIASKN